jgi:dipeptidyl aminopeptidase/acylaminoacyl peptidase
MRKIMLLGAATLLAMTAAAYAEPLGQFTDHQDIGKPRHPGSASYDAATGTYRITAGGQNMWANHDDFHYAWKKMSGDVRATVDVTFVSPSPPPGAPGVIHRKGGIVLRQDLDPDSAYVDVLRMGNEQLSLQYREKKGDETHLIWINTARQGAVRLEKIGDYVYLSVPGADGKLHHAGGSFKLHITGPYYIGLGVCPHDDNKTETMDFRNLRIEPAKAVAWPRDATLQTMAVANTHEDQLEQTAVVTTTRGLSDVAWSPDGKSLTYRSAGATWRVPADGMETRAPEKADAPASGPRENNAFVYYSDGKSGKLWRVRPNGSERMQVTRNEGTRDFSPHVSPDGKWLLYASAPAGLAQGKGGDLEIRLVPIVSGTPDMGRAVTMAKPFGGADALDFNPWSPDSRNFAFISRQPGA